MNKKKSLITALLLVVVAGLSITAGTFAYFQWTTGAEGGTQGVTFKALPNSTTYQYFRIYLFMSPSATDVNIIKDLKIEITWSEESIVETTTYTS